MIAVLGPKGTFCDKSYEEYNKKYEAAHGKSLEPLYCPTIDDVFEQLCTNEACEYAQYQELFAPDGCGNRQRIWRCYIFSPRQTV